MTDIHRDTEEQAAIFAALADPTRLKLMKLLQRQQGSTALCVNALAARLGVTQSAVSQHLRVLKSTGLVKGERRGCSMHYFVNKDNLEKCRSLTSAALGSEKSGAQPSCQEPCPEGKDQDASSC